MISLNLRTINTMGRKRKVPGGIELQKWSDSSSDNEVWSQNPIQVPRRTSPILREDLSPNPSVANSSSESERERGFFFKIKVKEIQQKSITSRMGT